MKKVIYIAGPITGVPEYKAKFDRAAADLRIMGFTPLSPAWLTEGLSNADYMRVDFSLIDTADAVLFLPGSIASAGARLEREYCEYTGKPYACTVAELGVILNGRP